MELYTDGTPAAIKNAPGLHLITENTPNGKKVQIMLEELKDVYNIQWTTSLIDLETDEQKKDWFLRLNPNGRIPVLIDNTCSPSFPVMESSAELLYLVDLFDGDNVFGFEDKYEQSEAIQWLFFWQASGQPNQGQNNHFSKSAPEKIPYAITRFKTETLRAYQVLEQHLSGNYKNIPRDFLAGKGKGKYSFADIGTWTWVRAWRYAGFIEVEMEAFPCLLGWIERIAEREAVKRGISGFYDSEENLGLRVAANV
ncbi:ad6ef050-bfee-494f-9b28-b81c04c1395a [Sclerotinia trifoliorum]|uniref:Ad6ef050-bfee-494f-9b28-b81c04c1395a n=1 Tax=Sclerotinia trifoliorum TaxID=28548 RepID=A0A8H2VL73_9HELO|nr:ad6ef050-bfee-494f-9b28-b81c04c1395a [Sclerotinia trifoliorum]